MSTFKFMDNLMAAIETYFPNFYLKLIGKSSTGQKPPQRNPNE